MSAVLSRVPNEPAAPKDDITFAVAPYDQMRSSYPADYPLASTFEEQTQRLVREYKGDGEYLSVHHPDEPDAGDDFPDSTALMVMKAATGKISEILFG